MGGVEVVLVERSGLRACDRRSPTRVAGNGKRKIAANPTSFIGVLALLRYYGLQMADPCEADGSYESTRVPDVHTPALNHFF